MSNSFYHERYCLTKAQREIIEPLLPAPKSTGRPALNSLTAFNAILWILSSGAAWRDLPPQFGNWNSIYHKFRKWCADDVFENILQALVVNTEKYLLVEIDSTFCKVHQHAAGARKKNGNQAIGVSRGGKTTKIHALVTENFQLIGLLLTGGQVHEVCQRTFEQGESRRQNGFGRQSFLFGSYSRVYSRARRQSLYSRQN